MKTDVYEKTLKWNDISQGRVTRVGKDIKVKHCFSLELILKTNFLNIWKCGIQFISPSTSININARIEFISNYGEDLCVCILEDV